LTKNKHERSKHDKPVPPGGMQGRGGHTGGPMGAPRAKVTDFKKSVKQLIAYCKVYLPLIIIALILAAAGAVFNILGPELLSRITDLVTEGLMSSIDLDAVVNFATILAFLYGVGFLFNYIQGFMMATVTQRVSKNLRTDISRKINRLPLKYFDSTSTGDVLSRVTNDVDMIGQTMNQSISTLVSAVTMFVGSLVMMFYTNWIMAISAILSTIVGFALMTFIITKSQKYFVEQQKELGKLNGHIEEIYSGHTVVRVYNGEKAAKETFHDINSRLYNSAWKSQFLSGLMMPLYIRLFTQPLSQLAQAANSLQSTAAASERVFEFLGEEELEDEGAKTTRLENAHGDVEFKNVRFGYDENKMVINNFSATAYAGQKVAIVGPTGAGKTTLINLLMRFYEVNGGEILIDGVPINQLTRKNIHELFCMVLQDTWLFEGTIRDNIVYNRKGVSHDEVEAACKAVGLHHFIKTLPNGYDTVLDDKANLSAGQKQLITIARAMVDHAPLLILDEATSSVDTRTEILIQQAMDKLTVGKTSFVIAHRLSTIKNADLILVMKDGDIIESGTHEELLLKNGFYAELYNSQFEEAS
jgi:ATP-binding cassette, subfamily B, multidrug efflux pump